MLKTLRIRNLVTIEDLEVEFAPGLNVLTGETGAGKSILVDALALAAGERGDASLVRSGAERAVVEAVFATARVAGLPALLDARGLDAADAELVVRREVAATGSGRVLVNGSPTTVAILREIGDQLLERHGQHEQQGLTSPERQLALLDAYGGHGDVLARAEAACAAVAAAAERVVRVDALGRDGRRRAEELGATIREIRSADPQPGEAERLGRERLVLQHASRVTELLHEALDRLDEGEDPAIAAVALAERRVHDLARIDESLEPLASRLLGARLELEDVRDSLADYRAGADFDPGRVEAIEGRRALLERLLLKWGPSEDDARRVAADAESELATLENLEGAAADARAALDQARASYVAAARALTEARRKAARLGSAVRRELAPLALPKARFEVEILPARGPVVETPEGPVPLTPRGADRAEFLLAANPGEPMRPLGRAASGGELSRVMLALHVALEDDGAGRALVFDEVDAGVSGAVALAVGARLARLARRHQVLCVTHLPQVAAFAASHYHVAKGVEAGRTRTAIERIDGEARVEALARMLGGREAGRAARGNAEELLAEAEEMTR